MLAPIITTRSLLRKKNPLSRSVAAAAGRAIGSSPRAASVVAVRPKKCRRFIGGAIGLRRESPRRGGPFWGEGAGSNWERVRRSGPRHQSVRLRPAGLPSGREAYEGSAAEMGVRDPL